MFDCDYFDNNGNLSIRNALKLSRYRSDIILDENTSRELANKLYPEYTYIERCKSFVRNIPYSNNNTILHNLRWPEDYEDMDDYIPKTYDGFRNNQVFGYDKSMEDLKYTDYKIDYVSAIERSFTKLIEEFDIDYDSDMVDVVLKLPNSVTFKVDEYEIRLLKDLIKNHPNLIPRIVVVLYEPTDVADACSVMIDYLAFKKRVCTSKVDVN